MAPLENASEQWAAEMRISGATNVAPQSWGELAITEEKNMNSPTVAVLPPIILGSAMTVVLVFALSNLVRMLLVFLSPWTFVSNIVNDDVRARFVTASSRSFWSTGGVD